MKRVFSIGLILFVLLSLLAAPVFAQDGGVEDVEPLVPAEIAENINDPVEETPSMYFVELRNLPTVDGSPLAMVQMDKVNFRREAKRAGLQYTERFAYNTLFNGLSIRIRPSQLARLANLPGVKAIYPVETIQAPEVPITEPELMTALAMTGADIAQSELGFTGKGIKVAVMDTGIDIDHPDLGGDGTPDGAPFPTGRVITGWDFVGDAYNADPAAATYNPIPAPDPNPDDCGGHGTHVAGIIGANGAIKGVAPEVSFGAYRVFGCEGSTESDIMIAAMERAYADGMQVLNMSIGSAFNWPQYPTAQAASRLVARGMVVVASIGNNGTSGLWAAGAPGLGDKVIGVASFDNSHVALNTFTISPDATPIGYAPATGSPLPPTEGSLPMARTGTPTTANDACSALPADSLTGQAVLIRRGTCSFFIKASNAMNAGAAAVVLYNNAPGRFSPTVAGTPEITIPVVAISDTEGVLINNRLAAGPVDLTWTAETGTFINPTGGLISSFSSYGLSPDLALKPDIGAPGGLIYSTYPLEDGGYANISGTSMASPHVAGAAALVLQAKPGLKATQMLAVLQNSADPKNWAGNPGLGFLDMVSRQGAGMVDIDDAILSKVLITPSKIAAGESQAGPYTTTLRLVNSGTETQIFRLSYVNALSVRNTYAPSATTSDAMVTFSADEVKVLPGGKPVLVTVTITPPTGPDKAQYGGYIVFTPVDQTQQTYRVPFAGFVGDYQSIQALTPTANGFPWLAILIDGFFYGPVEGPGDWAYTLEGDDVPYILLHLDHQVRTMKMELFKNKVQDGAGLVVYTEDLLPRNDTANGFYAFAWDGSYNKAGTLAKVPDGIYVLKLSFLKANGVASNPADWETWTSPAFTVDVP
jgi:subtilisin family serine protease